MTTGAPPPNWTFQSSKRIIPSVNIQPRLYNAAGVIPHPLEHFGQVGGAKLMNDMARLPVTVIAGDGPTLAPGGVAWSGLGHPHTINGREPGTNY